MAERRVALVIGNSAYKSVPRLTNPANDATLVGGMFKKAGFDNVDVRLDLNAADMRRSLREFAGRTRDAEVAVIYYAGHGIELDGTNYLIPTDAALETDGDVLDETVALDRALFAVACKAASPRHFGRMPRQSVRQDDEAHGRFPRHWAGSRQDRADQPEHHDRLRGEGGLDGIGWRLQK